LFKAPAVFHNFQAREWQAWCFCISCREVHEHKRLTHLDHLIALRSFKSIASSFLVAITVTLPAGAQSVPAQPSPQAASSPQASPSPETGASPKTESSSQEKSARQEQPAYIEFSNIHQGAGLSIRFRQKHGLPP
jgi:hypothetical protein